MRKDMARVIVERPRFPGRHRKGRPQTLEDAPAHEGMARPYALGSQPKLFNDHLAPLRRYVARQVGRPWDKVYSEITAHLRAGNLRDEHLRRHLFALVAVKPRRLGGTRYVDGGYRKQVERRWQQPFYVDPRSGLLKVTRRP